MRKLTMGEQAFADRIRMIGGFSEGEMDQIIDSIVDFSKTSRVYGPSILPIIYDKLHGGEWLKYQVLDFSIVKLHINNAIKMNLI